MITRWIYPLGLREKISRRMEKFFPRVSASDISVLGSPKLRLDLSATDFGHRQIIFNGFYEWQVTKKLVRLAGEGGVLVDVGANYGYYTCLFASLNPRNVVHAFEPSPANLDALRHNVAKNGLAENVVINAMALGREKGSFSFELHNEYGQSGWGGLSLKESACSIRVETVTLDEYALEKGLAFINVLKIDTEGADTWVLEGASGLLQQKKIGHIFFEENTGRMQQLGIEPNKAILLLKQRGYSVRQISATEYYAFAEGDKPLIV